MKKIILVFPTEGTLHVVIDGESYQKEMTAMTMVQLANQLLTKASSMMYLEQRKNEDDS